MRFALKALVHSNTKIPEDVAIEEGAYQIQLIRNNSGFIGEIQVSVAVEDYEELLPRQEGDFEMLPGGIRKAPDLVAPKNPHHHDLRELLQHYESLGCLLMEIRSIDWHQAESQWIPENEKEKEAISINSLRVFRDRREQPRPLNPAVVREIVQYRDANRALLEPFAFLRVALNEFRRGQYRSAFFNFYFFVEGLFAGGKYRGPQVKRNLRKSRELRAGVAYAIALFDSQWGESAFRELEELGAQSVSEWSVDNAIGFIVEARGHLLHYSRDDPRGRPNPLTEHRYERLAYFMMCVCLSVAPEFFARRMDE